MEDQQYFIGFRQTNRSAGKWVVMGPYRSYGEALKARKSMEALDAELTTPFLAKDEASAKMNPFVQD